MKRAKKSFFLASGLGVSAALAQIFSVMFTLAPVTLLAVPGDSILTEVNGGQSLTISDTADTIRFKASLDGSPAQDITDSTAAADLADFFDNGNPIEYSTIDTIVALFP